MNCWTRNCNIRIGEDPDLTGHTEYLFLCSSEISHNLYKWKSPLKEFLVVHRLWRHLCSINKNHCLTLLSEDKKKADWTTANTCQFITAPLEIVYPNANWRSWLDLTYSCSGISEELCSAYEEKVALKRSLEHCFGSFLM